MGVKADYEDMRDEAGAAAVLGHLTNRLWHITDSLRTLEEKGGGLSQLQLQGLLRKLGVVSEQLRYASADVLRERAN